MPMQSSKDSSKIFSIPYYEFVIYLFENHIKSSLLILSLFLISGLPPLPRRVSIKEKSFKINMHTFPKAMCQKRCTLKIFHSVRFNTCSDARIR